MGRFRVLAGIAGTVATLWLFVETGGWMQSMFSLDGNVLFWPFWAAVWITVATSSICWDLRHQAQVQKPRK